MGCIYQASGISCTDEHRHQHEQNHHQQHEHDEHYQLDKRNHLYRTKISDKESKLQPASTPRSESGSDSPDDRLHETQRSSSDRDDRRQETANEERQCATRVPTAISGNEDEVDGTTSFVPHLHFEVHGISETDPVSSRHRASPAIRIVRETLLRAKRRSDYSGRILDDMALSTEGAVDSSIEFGRSSFQATQGEERRIPGSFSSTGDDERHLLSNDALLQRTPVDHHDRGDRVSQRTADLRHDPARHRGSRLRRRVPDDHRSSWQDDLGDFASLYPLDAAELDGSRNDDHYEEERWHTTVPAQPLQLGSGTRQDPRHCSSDALECQRGTRAEKHTTRWIAEDGTAGILDGYDPRVLSALRCANADAIPELGRALHAPPWSDDRRDRRDLLRNGNDGPSSGDEEAAMSFGIQPSLSDRVSSKRDRLRMFAKRPTQVARLEHALLPLHVQIPPVPFIDWKRADELVAIASNPSDEKVWFTGTAFYRDEVACSSLFQIRNHDKDVSSDALLFNNDIDLLIESRFAIATNQTVAEFESANAGSFLYVKLFSAIEARPTGERRRIIAWPPSLNEAEQSISDALLQVHHARVIFNSASDVRDRGVRYKYAASLDFTKFFQQFELLTKTAWAFKYRNRVYLLSTVPTGAVFPPLFAQALSRTLLALSVRATNVADRVEHDSIIDNLRLCSDDLNALWVAWNELVSICNHLGATIGESHPPPLTSPTPYTYLGMLFSVVDTPRVELALKSKTKLTTAADLIMSGVPVLVIDVLALFGQTVWACTVTGFRLGELYHVIKFVRRVQRKQMNDHVEIWKSIRQLWSQSLLRMTTMHFNAPQNPTSSATMYTDSSLVGWGVVILDYHSHPLQVFAGKWSQAESSESINMLELRALRIGIRILSSIKNASEVIALNAFIDNTSARAWATRRRAQRWSTNQLALEIDDELRRSQIQLTSLNYVESANNLADKPSRVFIAE